MSLRNKYVVFVPGRGGSTHSSPAQTVKHHKREAKKCFHDLEAYAYIYDLSNGDTFKGYAGLNEFKRKHKVI